MRLVIQRVSSATVKINKKVFSQINYGLLILVAVNLEDSIKEAESLADKVSKIRLMKDKEEKMNLTVKDVDAEILAVSQFTLYADTSGGNRPSFIKAARPEQAEPIYEHFVESLRSKGLSVKTGKFGAYMEIHTTLDGPVTIIIDSK